MTSEDVDQFYSNLGEKIKKARTRGPKLSQSALGKIIGLSRTSIVNIENGRQHLQLHTLYQIAQVLKVEPINLFPSSQSEITDLPSSITSQVSANELPAVANILKLIKEEDSYGQNQKVSRRVAHKGKNK